MLKCECGNIAKWYCIECETGACKKHKYLHPDILLVLVVKGKLTERGKEKLKEFQDEYGTIKERLTKRR